MKAVGAFLGIPLVIGLLILMYIGVSVLIGNINAANRNNYVHDTIAAINEGTHYSVKNAQRSGVVKDEGDGVTFANGSLTFTVEVSYTGDYYLATTEVPYGTNHKFASADVTVNGQSAGRLTMGDDNNFDHCGESGCIPASIKIHLNAGKNTIVLSNGAPCSSCFGEITPITDIIVFSKNDSSQTSENPPASVPTVYTPPQPPAVHVDTSVNALTDRWNTHTWGGSRTNGFLQQYPIMVLNIVSNQGNTFSGTEKEGNNTATVTGTSNGSAFSFTVNGYTSTDSGANMLHCTFKGTVSQGAVQNGSWQCPDGRTGNFTLNAYAA